MFNITMSTTTVPGDRVLDDRGVRGASYAIIQVFLYLQVLDALTTLLGFRAGLVEGSPFVRILLHTGPVTGLLADKAIALLIAATCVWSGRLRLIRWANYWFAAVVGWNLVMILVRVSR
jgi:hypothetical protein